jgi:hypothetical protein
VAHDRQELRLGPVRGLGGLLGAQERGLRLLALGDVVADRLVFHRRALVVLDRALGPSDPEAPAVIEHHLRLEGVRLVGDGRAGAK